MEKQKELALLSRAEHMACFAEARDAYRPGEVPRLEDHADRCRTDGWARLLPAGPRAREDVDRLDRPVLEGIWEEVQVLQRDP